MWEEGLCRVEVELCVPEYEFLILCYCYSEIISSVFLGGGVVLVQFEEIMAVFIIPI